MKQFNTLALAALSSICSIAASAQDVHFSQIFETPVLRNPAIAGLFTGDIRVQSVFRSQWSSVTTPYQTTSLSGEFKKKVGSGDDFITIGGQFLNDKAGSVALTTTQISPALNYHKAMSADRNTYLSLGFMAGIIQRKFDRSKITTNSQFDGEKFDNTLGDGENSVIPSYTYFDGTVGMSISSQLGENENDNFYFGYSYHHFNKSRKNSFYESDATRVIPKNVVSGGVRMSMGNYAYMTVQSDYVVQGTSKELVMGAMYSTNLQRDEDSKYKLHIGSYIRWADAIIPVVKIENGNLAIATSYDANFSSLKNSSRGRGGFEVSLTYQKNRRDNSSLESVRCPRF